MRLQMFLGLKLRHFLTTSALVNSPKFCKNNCLSYPCQTH